MPDGTVLTGTVESTLGRFLFNEILPQDLRFRRPKQFREMNLLPEVDFLVAKKQLKQILEKVINTHGATKTAEVLDAIKATGYKYSTRAAMTVCHCRYDSSASETGNDSEQAQDTVDLNYKELSNVVLSPRKSVTKKLLKHGRRPTMS